MDKKDKRERKPNFSDNEIRLLLEGITEEKDIIQSRLQSTVTFKRKKQAWGTIVDTVNAGSMVRRDEEDCRKKWRDLKSAIVKEQSEQRRTGGGGPAKPNPFKDVVMSIIGDDGNSIISGIDGVLLLTNTAYHMDSSILDFWLRFISPNFNSLSLIMTLTLNLTLTLTLSLTTITLTLTLCHMEFGELKFGEMKGHRISIGLQVSEKYIKVHRISGRVRVRFEVLVRISVRHGNSAGSG